MGISGVLKLSIDFIIVFRVVLLYCKNKINKNLEVGGLGWC